MSFRLVLPTLRCQLNIVRIYIEQLYYPSTAIIKGRQTEETAYGSWNATGESCLLFRCQSLETTIQIMTISVEITAIESVSVSALVASISAGITLKLRSWTVQLTRDAPKDLSIR